MGPMAFAGLVEIITHAVLETSEQSHQIRDQRGKRRYFHLPSCSGVQMMRVILRELAHAANHAARRTFVTVHDRARNTSAAIHDSYADAL